jgi:phage terminase Nu1 subunit (DNA packaging protein)
MDDALLKSYPLPEGVDDNEMNRGQLATAFGVSTNTIDKWIREGMPVVQEGTNGQSYVLRLSECWAWREAGRADDRAKKAAGDSSVQQLRMHFLGLNDDIPRVHLSASQRLTEAQAEMAWNKAARDRRELIHLSEAEQLLSDVFGRFRSGLQGLPDWAERTLGLTPPQMEELIAFCNGVLDSTANEIEADHLGGDDDLPLLKAMKG